MPHALAHECWSHVQMLGGGGRGGVGVAGHMSRCCGGRGGGRRYLAAQAQGINAGLAGK